MTTGIDLWRDPCEAATHFLLILAADNVVFSVLKVST